MKYKCPCCGYYTFESPINSTYDICPVCFWEDDRWQLINPNQGGGVNRVSLNQVRENYKEFGACEYEMKEHVRAAGIDDEICADISKLLIENKRINLS